MAKAKHYDELMAARAVVHALATTTVYDTIDSAAGKRVCILCFATVRRDHINQGQDVQLHNHACPWRMALEYEKEHQS